MRALNPTSRVCYTYSYVCVYRDWFLQRPIEIDLPEHQSIVFLFAFTGAARCRSFGAGRE